MAVKRKVTKKKTTKKKVAAVNRQAELISKLRADLKAAKAEGGSFGFNLIVNKSNIKYKGQLEVICEEGCDFIITSLGSPEETIKQAKVKGIKVFCDVTDLKFAKLKGPYLGQKLPGIKPEIFAPELISMKEYKENGCCLIASRRCSVDIFMI